MKPKIVVMSAANDEALEWVSEDWNSVTNGSAGTQLAAVLMRRARAAIRMANNVEEAVALLRDAGFEVTWLGDKR